MKCPECEKAGLRSRLYLGAIYSTAMGGGEPWYDEDGKLHRHDLNIVSRSYTCSNGHNGNQDLSPRCPTCGWHRSSQAAPR